MVTLWRCRPPHRLSFSGADPRQSTDTRRPHESSDVGIGEHTTVAGASDLSCTSVDRSTPLLQVPRSDEGPGPARVRRRQTSAGRRHRLADGIGGHFDAVFALALLSLRDPDHAQQVVIDAFTAASGEHMDDLACQSRLWRSLADSVHLAGEAPGGRSRGRPASFRDGGLPCHEREAIAVVLGGRSDRQAALLLDVSLGTFRRHLRTGLRAVHTVMLIDPDTTARAIRREGTG